MGLTWIKYQPQVVSRISSINSMGFHNLPVWKVHLECEGAADPSKWRVKFAEAEDEAEDAGVLWTKMLWGWTALCFDVLCKNVWKQRTYWVCAWMYAAPSFTLGENMKSTFSGLAKISLFFLQNGLCSMMLHIGEGWADPLLEISFLVFCGWNLVVSFVSAWSC